MAVYMYMYMCIHDCMYIHVYVQCHVYIIMLCKYMCILCYVNTCTCMFIIIIIHVYTIPHSETQAYVLNFHGRVTQASVKNFQLVHSADREQYCTCTCTCIIILCKVFMRPVLVLLYTPLSYYRELHCGAVWSYLRGCVHSGLPLSRVCCAGLCHSSQQFRLKTSLRMTLAQIY